MKSAVMKSCVLHHSLVLQSLCSIKTLIDSSRPTNARRSLSRPHKASHWIKEKERKKKRKHKKPTHAWKRLLLGRRQKQSKVLQTAAGWLVGGAMTAAAVRLFIQQNKSKSKSAHSHQPVVTGSSARAQTGRRLF